MTMSIRSRFAVVATALTLAVAAAAAARASSPPVGPLPAGPTASIVTNRGELVAVALPHRSNGRAWRIVRISNSGVLRQVSEADVGGNVVLVFRATASGTASVVFALTRGERPKAYESRFFMVRVR